jgi:hypothetical protein
VKPYLIDLETTNGMCCPARDVLQFTRCPAHASDSSVTLLAGTFLKSGTTWNRIEAARYYELKDGASTKTPDLPAHSPSSDAAVGDVVRFGESTRE